ncbi:hypothetical protein ACGFWE_38725 [Streptomyces sp. NPDC048523]|uniref:hypothetical protein n=1 Tax=Streptomyces sp. NPDC048523 TaxID=3365567 RepID=UPI00371B0FB9
MNLRKRVITVVFLAATALGALGAPAMAVPMPWETSKVPAIPAVPAVTAVPVATGGHIGTVTVRCGPPCYQ